MNKKYYVPCKFEELGRNTISASDTNLQAIWWERWWQKGKRENDEAAFYLIQGKKEKMLESIQSYKDYRSRNE